MRRLLLVLTLLGAGCTTVRQLRSPAALTVDGRATRTRTEDALDYSIAIYIAAPPEAVWKVITDAKGYLSWNSTLVSLSGAIEPDGRVELVSKVARDRTFTLKVSAFEAPRRMVWEDGNGMFLGVRCFTLIPKEQGTVFAMSETYSGFFLGSAEKEMPDFRDNFETYVGDLKRVLEASGGEIGR